MHAIHGIGGEFRGSDLASGRGVSMKKDRHVDF
jgi:hypothetical protein